MTSALEFGSVRTIDAADAAGRAATASGALLFGGGLVLGNNVVGEQMLRFIFFPYLDETSTRVGAVLNWPWWAVPSQGVPIDSVVTTVAPLLLAAVVAYALLRWRLNRRPMTAARVFWGSWLACVLGGVAGAVLQLIPLVTTGGGVAPFWAGGPPWWLIAYGGGWGALTGLVAGIGSVLATRSHRIRG